MNAHAVIPPPREANGRRKRVKSTQQALNEMNAREAAKTRETVLNQPHRRGVESPLLESALGRFIYKYAMERELFDAGMEYARIHGLLMAAIEAPRNERHGGGETIVDKETVDKWTNTLAGWREAMSELGRYDASRIVIDMACFEIDAPETCDALKVMAALMALGKATGKV